MKYTILVATNSVFIEYITPLYYEKELPKHLSVCDEGDSDYNWSVEQENC